ncbi:MULTISPECIES: 4-hydroxy-tetrahydrodipicolinate reductase [Dyella]|uniref:4-hydroxy-tetrahydrodipicolinate reductase n=2 Tax=Dyella TaxID=231454 RepID=A0A4R0YUX5_9GAMM|nr:MULTISPECIES: 4-hydroxy-tetrahydrodipicolinate reductase [Dyella]TBR39290.1 4-hydroxy-tetrahydrodipicolinate reductase [Dyella terrae]TCI13122.1 4-hydroxy-tetrahydrodipicolinate reductase [Dyella soli]
MSRPVRLAIQGATGRMGQALLALLRNDERFELVAALTAPDAAQLGTPIYVGEDSGLRFSHAWPASGELDVVIDFSGPSGLADALAYCQAQGVALVTGTTGLDKALQDKLAAASATIPLLRSANFSLGVAVLKRLLREAAAALPDWDLDIVEAHHSRKEDAPSGTALALGEAAASARGTTLGESAVYAREGRTGPRQAGTIGFAVIRGGDIVGEHESLLMGQGERIELNHRATDRSIFARGAIEAAHWLAGHEPGAYDLDAMLNERTAR